MSLAQCAKKMTSDKGTRSCQTPSGADISEAVIPTVYLGTHPRRSPQDETNEPLLAYQMAEALPVSPTQESIYTRSIESPLRPASCTCYLTHEL